MTEHNGAYRITAAHAGSADILLPQPYEPPSPGPDDLLVETKAIGVNFIDTYQRSGIYPVTYPFTPGSEGSGVVIEVGKNVGAFRQGDRVMWSGAPQSYATHVLVPRDNAVIMPKDLGFEEAASIPLQGLTAHYLARSSFSLTQGDIALIHAGAGGVGLLLTQIAKALGAVVITTVSSDEKEILSRSAGADAVIRYDRYEDISRQLPAEVHMLSEQLRTRTNIQSPFGSGVDVVYDGVGQSTFEASLKSLRIRGTLVLFGGASGQVAPFDLQGLNANGSLSITRPSLGHFLLNRKELESRYDDLLAWRSQGKLVFRHEHTFHLDDAAQAHRALEGRQTTGKVVLLPQ